MSRALTISLAGVASLVVAAGLLALTSPPVLTYAILSPAAQFAMFASSLVLLGAAWVTATTSDRASLSVTLSVLSITWSAPIFAGWDAAPSPVRIAARAIGSFAVPLLLVVIVTVGSGRAKTSARSWVAGLFAATVVVSGFVVLTRNAFYDVRCWADCLVPPVVSTTGVGLTVAGHYVSAALCGVGLVLATRAAASSASQRRSATAAGIVVGALLAVVAETATVVAALMIPVSAAAWAPLMGMLLVVAAAAVSAVGFYVIIDGVRLRVRLSRVEQLGTQLSRLPARGQAQSALADLLADESVAIVFPYGTDGQLIDASGRTVHLQVSAGRRQLEIRRAGSPIAYLDVTSTRDVAGPLTNRIGSASLVAIDNERLDAEIRAQLAELRRSRTRIVEAADDSRRRTERDLHDGAQSALVGLLYSLTASARRHGDGWEQADTEFIDILTSSLQGITTRLREIAHGVFPADLENTGLDEAIRTLLDRADVTTNLSISLEGPPSPAVERFAYFATKRLLDAEHRSVSFQIKSAPQQLSLRCTGRVLPDGLGDQVAALDGSLRMDGDDIVIEVPCG